MSFNCTHVSADVLRSPGIFSDFCDTLNCSCWLLNFGGLFPDQI